jgi:hypothetical protein
MRGTIFSLVVLLTKPSGAIASQNVPGHLKNDVLKALANRAECQAIFAPYAAQIMGQSQVNLPEFNLTDGPNLSEGNVVYGYPQSRVFLQDVAPMVSLTHAQARRGTLVFTSPNKTFKIGELAFQFAADGALMSCEPRGYVVFGLNNLLELRQVLESPAGDNDRALADYIRIKNATTNAPPSLRYRIPNRGNMGWIVMDRVYHYGLLHLLQKHSEEYSGLLDTYPAKITSYVKPARNNLIAVANRSLVHVHGFNFSSWQGDALTVAQISLGVASGWDWFRDELSDEDQQHVKQALITKSFNYFYAAYQKLRSPDTPTIIPNPPSTWWATSASNWNLVCHSSILVMLKVLSYEVNPEEEPVLAERMRNLFSWITRETRTKETGTATPLQFGLTSIVREDGGWYEGPNYWHYAMFNMAAMLSTYSRGDLSLQGSSGLTINKLKTTMKYGLSMRSPLSGAPANFSDCDDRPMFYPAVYWLARSTNVPDATRRETDFDSKNLEKSPQSQSYRGFFDALGLVWRDNHHLTLNAQSVPNFLDLTEHFSTTSVGRVEDKTSGKNMYLALKGGTSRSHHRQRENGNFIFEASGVRWAMDLGAEEYGHNLPAPLSSLSQIFYRQRNDGNNTLSVDTRYSDEVHNPGEMQNEFADSPMQMDALTSGDVIATSMNLTSAYQNGAGGRFGSKLTRYIRSFKMDVSQNARLQIFDKFNLTGTLPQARPIVIWNMHTFGTMANVQPPQPSNDSSERTLLLERDGKRLKLVAKVTNGNIVNFALEAIPRPQTSGTKGHAAWHDIAKIGNTNFQQIYRDLPSGARVVRLRVRPDNTDPSSAVETTIQVSLVPEN